MIDWIALRVAAKFLLVGLGSSQLPASAHAMLPSKTVTVRDCAHCPEMVVIPAGSFVMGTEAGDPLHDALEGPTRRANIGRFAAGRFDVTRAEWATFVQMTRRPTVKGCQWTGKSGPAGEAASAWNDLGFYQSPDDPVVCVTWQDAQDYTRWLSRTTGKKYRLLSESEWEYAARAGTNSAYFWASGSSHDHANHGTETCCGGVAEGRDRWIKTSPGNAFPPNSFGLYDMSKNVLQWVEDCFSPSYAGLPTDGSAFRQARPIKDSGDLRELDGVSTCAFRVVRGGDWGDQRRWIRTASRSFAPPPGHGSGLASYRSGGVGFRVARTLP